MFCFYCGKEIGDDEIFCPFCGEKLKQDDESADRMEDSTIEDYSSEEDYFEEGPQEETFAEPVNDDYPGKSMELQLRDDAFVNEQYELERIWEDRSKKPGKKSKGSTIAIIILSVLLAAGLGTGAFLWFGNTGTEEVDLKSLMNDSVVSGYDGFGQMEQTLLVDEEKMEAFLGTIKNDENRSAVKGVLLTVKYRPDKHEKLSNGDTVTITAEYDKEMAESIKLTVLNDSFEYTVEGLEEGQDLAYDPAACDYSNGDFVFPESDEVELSREDIFYMVGNDKDLVQRGINEIYARHGMIFEESDLKNLYAHSDWYKPMYKKDEIQSSWFNSYENANIKTLATYRDALKKMEATGDEYISCFDCGTVIKKSESVEDANGYYCEACFYDSPDDQDPY